MLLPPSFVKITQVEVWRLCPVPTTHTSSLMLEAWVGFFFFFSFLKHEFPRVATKPFSNGGDAMVAEVMV